MRQLLALVVVVLLATPAFASCGSANCPFDPSSVALAGRYSLDVAFESIEQRHLRFGSFAGTPEHQEIATTNQTARLLFTYTPTARVELSASIPYISRMHEHVDEAGEFQRWDLRGFGDAMLHARVRVADNFWSTAGVKLPTGARRTINREGEAAEVPLQAGSGSTDWMAGLAYQLGFRRDDATDMTSPGSTQWPLFVSVVARHNGIGTDHYRNGKELQFNAGTAHPFLHNADALLQLNARLRSRDSVDGVRDAFTGGTYVFISPGARVRLGGRTAVYGLVQIPLVRHVNGVQLTSSANFVSGIQVRW
jgi:hypothetical protein